MYRPPSMQTLRALDAAMRHHSFSRAADELGVTHGAVSHRIREVEARLGVAMFERQGHSMEPTAAAKQMIPVIRQALDLIASVFPPPVTDQTQVLRVGVLPSFAAHWLVPRLEDFHSRNPTISIDLVARLEPSPIGPGGLDAAIRYGDGKWPALHVRHLINDVVFPACAPSYKTRLRIESIDDLDRCHLLRSAWSPWTPWFQKAGLSLREPQDSLPYEDSGLILDAAIAGHGVVLARSVIAHDALSDGRLVRLSDIERPTGSGYFFVTLQEDASKSDAKDAFFSWLLGRICDPAD